jgi:two-component system, sensor histidine kinase
MTTSAVGDLYSTTFLRQRRITLIIASIVWLLNTIPDWMLHSGKPIIVPLLIIRLAICWPLFLVYVSASFSPRFKDESFAMLVLIGCISTAWFGMAAMQWQLPASNIVSEFGPAFSQIALVLLCVVRLRFKATLITSAVCFFSYCTFVVLQVARDKPENGDDILVNAIQNLLLFFILGLIASKNLEQHYESEKIALKQSELQNVTLTDALAMTQQLRLNAEEAIRDKAQFLVQASHDLRQPMQAIGILVAVLKLEARDERMIERVSTLERAVRSMDDLFRSMLDINRLEASVIKIDKEAHYLPELIEDIALESEYTARAKGLELRYRVSQGLRVETDAVVLRRILRNLIVNAITYTNKGTVLITLRRCGANALIQVWDTGVGIAPDQLNKIFEVYARVGTPDQRTRKGLGLGLAIAKGMAELISTRVRVKSKLGSGSVFSFELPLTSARTKAPDHKLDVSKASNPTSISVYFERRTIVIIENDISILDALAELFVSYGANVIACRNLVEFENKLAQTGAPPDLLLIDIELDDSETAWDAIEIGQRIKTNYAVLLMTGAVRLEQELKAKEMGIEIIQKPFAPDQIIEKIRSVLRR